jgi:hypothetical protein
LFSNNEIVEWIYRNLNVKSLIKKYINKSIYDDSCSDLEQYIYEKLLHKPNDILNFYYNNKQLTEYIVQIIKNQRNEKASYYNYKILGKQLNKILNEINDPIYDTQYINNCFEDNSDYTIEDIDIPYVDKIENEIISEIITNKENILINFFRNDRYTGTTEEEKTNFLAISILASHLGIEIINNQIVMIKKVNIRQLTEDFIDENVNKKNLKSKRYLISNYIKKGKRLLEVELLKFKYI